MNGRRFYVIVAEGERGPFSHEELREALEAREITQRDQVRSGMGTALGTVGEVLARSSSSAPPLIGQTTDGLPPVRVFRPLPLVILGVSVVPAVILLVLLRAPGGEVVPGNRPDSTPAPVAEVPKTPAPLPITPAPSPSTNPPPAKPVPTPTTSASPSVQATKTGEPSKFVSPEADGRLLLRAEVAHLKGPDITKVDSSEGISVKGWKVGINSAAWLVQFANPGTYRVVARYACPDNLAGGEVEFGVGNGRRLRHVVVGTGTWANQRDFTLGTVKLNLKGTRSVMVEPIAAKGQDVWSLSAITLIPE
jgi:hypothetical protein